MAVLNYFWKYQINSDWYFSKIIPAITYVLGLRCTYLVFVLQNPHVPLFQIEKLIRSPALLLVLIPVRTTKYYQHGLPNVKSKLLASFLSVRSYSNLIQTCLPCVRTPSRYFSFPVRILNRPVKIFSNTPTKEYSYLPSHDRQGNRSKFNLPDKIWVFQELVWSQKNAQTL